MRGGPDDDESVELVEKLGRNDPCPCGSGKRFQDLLPERRPLSTGPNGMTIGGEGGGLEPDDLRLDRHCEEHSDEAIQSPDHGTGLPRFARG